MSAKEYRGLSTNEIEVRLKEYGLNELQSKKRVSPIKIFLSQFNDLIIWILMVATVISGFMGDKADAITILIIIVMNGILGFVQEFKTEKSLEQLKKLSSPTAKVIRDGKIEVINSIYLVPGDLVILESGDRIPADSILIEGNNLMMDESLLTGESVGVHKSPEDSENNIYMGTIVLTGRGKAKVYGTGMNTEMGRIAHMLHSIEDEPSPLKERLNSLGKVLVVLCIAICAVVTFLGIYRGENIYDMFLSGVSLAVAAIPEGLSAIVTVALALGVSRMLKRNALVRKLPAVETLGCTSVICSDKTGTLTENRMTITALLHNGKIHDIDEDKSFDHDILKKIFVYCNDCNYNYSSNSMEKALMGDPTETALIKGFFKKVSEIETFNCKVERIFDIPFDSTRKMMTVIVKDTTTRKDTCYVKGAPERVLDRCSHILVNGRVEPLTIPYRRSVEKLIDDMSFRALRCIAGAYKEDNLIKGDKVENSLVFVGVAGIIDPPRKEVKDAVLRCRVAGIRPVMITGDHKNTAFAIGKDLNICNESKEVITGAELDRISDKELEKSIDDYKIFARVSPKHKLRIVKAFKSRGNIVAMTGDGVNDAPAIKEADIGIAMGISGTDVTKEAASMILLDDNFATIVTAVEEGRVIYDNIRKFIRYLLSCNLGEVLTMFLASLFYLEVPLLPIQILFVNLVTDGLPAIALGVDPPNKNIMYEKPRKKGESVFARGLKEKILIRGALIGVCTVLAFLAGKYYGYGLGVCRTLALGTLICSQLIHVFECRSEKYSLFEINPFTNMYLIGSVVISVTALLLVIYVPVLQGIFHTMSIGIGQWAIIVFFSGIISFINSIATFVGNRS
ncbi:calcium-translocating P-type ATPase, PMCA-type [uncultured Clostridium sp.]|uniref:calcium-translocating P-type ATPase, PMCA-type n=1 Tax=uncultured Clostridium sp. TaxID=59620 RepID=UPI003216217B